VLPVHMLHELLDRRKNATSPSSLASLAESYGVDQGLLGQLASVVNSPSVRAGTGVQHVRTDTGEETFSTIVSGRCYKFLSVLITYCDLGPVG